MPKYALLVGIDLYKGYYRSLGKRQTMKPLPRLYGCVNDVDAVEQMLVARGFGDIKKLTDKAATTDNIQQGLQALIAGINPGDQALFHFSGHGSLYTAPVAPGADPGPILEVLCPHDMDWDAGKFISPEWLATQVNGLRDRAALEIVVDACCAGGMQGIGRTFGLFPARNRVSLFNDFAAGPRVRISSDASQSGNFPDGGQFNFGLASLLKNMPKSPPGSRPRFMPPPPDVLRRVIAGIKSGSSTDTDISTIGSGGPRRCIVWASSTVFQSSDEYKPNGHAREQGAFTWFLLKALQSNAAPQENAVLQQNVAPANRSQLLGQIQGELTGAKFPQQPQFYPDSPYIDSKQFLEPGNFPPDPP